MLNSNSVNAMDEFMHFIFSVGYASLKERERENELQTIDMYIEI